MCFAGCVVDQDVSGGGVGPPPAGRRVENQADEDGAGEDSVAGPSARSRVARQTCRLEYRPDTRRRHAASGMMRGSASRAPLDSGAPASYGKERLMTAYVGETAGANRGEALLWAAPTGALPAPPIDTRPQVLPIGELE